jgi:O-phosphoseryl-tRNA synthetase
MWNVDEIRKMAKKDFDKAWEDTANFVSEDRMGFVPRKGEGERQCIEELKARLRKYLIDSGYDELNLPATFDVGKAQRQIGPEAAIVLESACIVEGKYLAHPSLSPWLESITELKAKKPMPLQLFSMGARYRKVKGNVLASQVASVVLMDERVSLEDGKELAVSVLNALGIKGGSFQKSIDSKLYAKEAQQSVFVQRGEKQVKIGEFGIYSPIALANFNIEYPVFCFDIFVEPAAMVFGGYDDVKEVSFAQFHATFNLSDQQILGLVKLSRQPKTEVGKAISRAVVKTAELYGQHQSPCRFKAFEQTMKDKRIEVWLIKQESGSKLCGSDVLNELYVHEGNIVAFPPSGKDRAKGGVRTGIRFINALADLAAWTAEGMKSGYEVIQVKQVNNWNDVNIEVPQVVLNNAKRNNKEISVRGDVSTSIEIKFA